MILYFINVVDDINKIAMYRFRILAKYWTVVSI